MILKASLALIALACPAGAETALLSMEFPSETFSLSPDSEMEAEMVLDMNGQGAIAIWLDPSEAKAFGLFTSRHVGEVAVIRICDVEVSRPLLQTPLLGGSLMIVSDVATNIERWLGILNARSCDPAPDI
ncbi:MAG: hypothetical protein JNK34_01775 [Tabrizicola sp.]|nr:hypothetical protein [Tabrizicola sp.]